MLFLTNQLMLVKNQLILLSLSAVDNREFTFFKQIMLLIARGACKASKADFRKHS